MAAKVGTVRILYRESTISLQVAVYPEHTLGALNMKEEEGGHLTKLHTGLSIFCIGMYIII